MSKIDETQFLKNERPNEYRISVAFEGAVSVTVEAGSMEEAEAKAEGLVDASDFDVCPEDIADARVQSVRKTPAMYLVMREGQKMQVSFLKDGDLPRQPDERGF